MKDNFERTVFERYGLRFGDMHYRDEVIGIRSTFLGAAASALFTGNYLNNACQEQKEELFLYFLILDDILRDMQEAFDEWEREKRKRGALDGIIS